MDVECIKRIWQCSNLLFNNRRILDLLAEQLINEETVYDKDVYEMIEETEIYVD